MNPRMRRATRALVGTLVATVVGVAAYALWLFLFLLYARDGGPMRPVLWVLAPIVTALGFTCGVALVERPWERRGVSLARSLGWPLAGCVIGGVITAAFGPMWIGMGLLVGGGLSVATLMLRSVR